MSASETVTARMPGEPISAPRSGYAAPTDAEIGLARAAPPTRSSRREAWRDAACLGSLFHACLVAACYLPPTFAWRTITTLLLGVLIAAASMTVLHDGMHRRFSPRHSWWNSVPVHVALPVGVWVERWAAKHVRVHHRVTGVFPYDDHTQSSLVLRLHDAAKWRPYHRVQHVYAWMVYPLFWFAEQGAQVRCLWKGDLIDTDRAARPGRVALSFVAERVTSLCVLAPYVRFVGCSELASILFPSLILGGALSATVLAVGHVNEGLRPASGLARETSWLQNAYRSTASFGTSSRMIRWFTGGLTHHLAHHVYPGAARADLPGLTKMLRGTEARNAGLVAIEFESLRDAVRGHQRTLRRLGQQVRRLDAWTDSSPRSAEVNASFVTIL